MYNALPATSIRGRLLLRSTLIGLWAITVNQMAFSQQTGLSEDQYAAEKAAGTLVGGTPVITPMVHPSAPSHTSGSARTASSCDCWIPPDGSYTLAIGPSDDGSSTAITLPFTFNLYSETYNTLYINNNGNISFNSPWSTYSPVGFPSSSYKMIAPFWGDVDTENGGSVWYKLTPTAIYVNWVDVGYYYENNDTSNSFQLILTDGSDPVMPPGVNVSFCYKDMQWSTGDASGGSGGFGGSPATVGANRGNGINFVQFGQFDQAGNAYDGPFGTNDGVDWLDGRSFEFITTSTGVNIPPIATSHVCDTITACVGQATDIAMEFLSPEATQTTTVNAINSTLSNFTITSNLPGNTANITANTIPAASDVGFHTVTFTGTDNGSPMLTTTVEVIVQVLSEPGPISISSTPVCTGVETLAATAGFASYLWSNGATGPSITATAGNYVVTGYQGSICGSSSTPYIVAPDPDPPTIICPASIATYSTTASCSRTVNYTAPVGMDNCPGATTTRTAGLSSGSSFPRGVNTVTYQVTDLGGQTAQCSFTISVLDTISPTISCPGNITTNVSSGSCGQNVSYITPTRADNCFGSTLARIAGPSSGSNFPAGVTPVTYRVTDASGNTSQCTFSVTVVENVAPTITCPSNVVTGTNAGCTATGVSLGTPVTGDNCGVASVTNNAPAALPLGPTSVTWTVADGNGNTATCAQSVIIIDNTPPTLACPANISVNATAGTCGKAVTYVAPVGTDNCSGVTTARTAGLASGSTFPVGVSAVTYTATDAAGNSTSCSFTVTVVDNIPPALACPSNITVNATAGTCGKAVTYVAPVGTDNCSGVTTARTAGLASGSIFPVGVSTVTYTATDGAGNSTSCSFPVTVVDDIPPALACPADISAGPDAGGCSAVITYTAPVGTDNCSGVTTTLLSGPISGSNLAPGSYTVVYRATDAAGNTDCSFVITVVPSADHDGDGICDNMDLDSDNDGIPDVLEGGDLLDSDGDGVPDRFDLDSDNDGIYDVLEAGSGMSFTNGVLNGPVNPTGIPLVVDMDGNAVVDYAIMDSDGDGTIDAIELDSDGDGCNDVIEAGFIDSDGDGSPGNVPLIVDGNGLVTSLTP
jgi:hypothetical protein